MLAKRNLLYLSIITFLRHVHSQGTFGGFGGEVLATHTGGLSRTGSRPSDAHVIPAGIGDDLMTFVTERVVLNEPPRTAPPPPAVPSGVVMVDSEQPHDMPTLPNPASGQQRFASANSQSGSMAGGSQFQSMGSEQSNTLTGGYGGSGYGGDGDGRGGSGGGNAGYGGYPGRGGLAGYWEPGVKVVPLALQGWGLFIPRPPVEITTPTTTTTTTPRPTTSTARPTAAPTAAPTPAPTTTPTTTTTRPPPPPTTTIFPYNPYGTYTYPSVNYPSYGAASAPANYQSYSSVANRNIPQFFMMNGRPVMLTPVEDRDTTPKEPGVFRGQGVQVDVSGRAPSVCVPRTAVNSKGICVRTFGGFGGEVLATHTGGLSRPSGPRPPGRIIPAGIGDDLMTFVDERLVTEAPPARPAPAPAPAPSQIFMVDSEQPHDLPIMPNLASGQQQRFVSAHSQFSSMAGASQLQSTGSVPNNQFNSMGNAQSNSLTGGYGSGYGGDGDGGGRNGGANAGYGGYPGRGGLAGYWEPGVKVVPLALQGWGLFIPRPPVEITTPTTTTTTTPRPLTTTPRPTAASTPAPTPPSTSPTITSTTRLPTPPTTTLLPYNPYGTYTYPSVSSPSYGAASAPATYQSYSSVANRNIPQFFMMNGRPVMLTPAEDRDATIKEPGVFRHQGVQADVSVRNPPVCVPRTAVNSKGICVSEAQLQMSCSDMVISTSDTCAVNQFCCFLDNNMK